MCSESKCPLDQLSPSYRLRSRDGLCGVIVCGFSRSCERKLGWEKLGPPVCGIVIWASRTLVGSCIFYQRWTTNIKRGAAKYAQFMGSRRNHLDKLFLFNSSRMLEYIRCLIHTGILLLPSYTIFTHLPCMKNKGPTLPLVFSIQKSFLMSSLLVWGQGLVPGRGCPQ